MKAAVISLGSTSSQMVAESMKKYFKKNLEKNQVITGVSG